MQWISPERHKILYLPRLIEFPFSTHDSIEMADTDVHIPVDDGFLSAWHFDSAYQFSPAHISAALQEIGVTFGRLAKAGQGQTRVDVKSSAQDLVTEMDRGIEMLFRLWVKQALPKHKIIGEESFKGPIGPEDWVWYVDPIDGTTNYTLSLDKVSLHLGCVAQGKAQIAFVGLPILDQFFCGYGDQHTLQAADTPDFRFVPPAASAPLAFGTEYMPHRLREEQFFQQLLSQFNAQRVQEKSIGMNMLHLLTGQSHVFYKPHVKLWDIVAPLCLLSFCAADYFDMVLFIPPSGSLRGDNMIEISPFSNSIAMVHRINSKHLGNCRAGHVLVTPKDRPDIKAYIIEHIFKHWDDHLDHRLDVTDSASDDSSYV